MANDLTALGDFHLDNPQKAPPRAPFQFGLIEEEPHWIDSLMADLETQQVDLTSCRTEVTSEDTANYDMMPSSDTEQRHSDGNLPLDMNDPSVLSDYTSLLLFTNNPLAHDLEIEHCDSSKQATIRSLAARLDLQCSYDALGVVRLRKKTYRSVSGQGQHPKQPGAGNGSFIPSRSQIPSASSRPRPRNSTATRRRESFTSAAAEPFPPPTHDGMAMDLDSVSNDLNFGSFDPSGGHDSYYPASPQYQDLSEDEASSSPWRNSWAGLSRTLKEVGACWRCRILRKKCDPDQPCKACPKPGTYNSRWQTIGCKRGTLVDHTPRISLCPRADVAAGNNANGTPNTAQRMIYVPIDDRVEQCLQDASNRLDSVFASKDDTYTKIVLEILCSPLPVVTDLPPSLRPDVEGNVVHIAWGLIDATSAKKMLSTKSVEHILEVIKAAVIYETEYGQSQAVPKAIECFRSCIEILRLHDSGLLTPEAHTKCDAAKCRINAIQDLTSSIVSFKDELSKIVFRKDNRPHERRWWLSAFYSLWIQSHVRRIILIMSQSKVQLSASMKQACSEYLLLALDLFDAASASFDPLVSAWSLEEEPSNMDLRLMKYYLHAQKALLTDQWVRTVGSSMNYLRQLYQDVDNFPARYFQGDSSVSSLGNNDMDEYGPTSTRPPSFQPSKLAYSGSKFSVPLRTRSGAKRRAGSPLHDVDLIRRNGSSSSMLDSRDIRSRGLSIATPASPMSSAYSFAYGTSNSTRWNDSGDSLAEMAKLFSSSPPNPQDQLSYSNPSKGYTPSLHYKSSNESFLELRRTLSNRRQPTRNTPQGGNPAGFLCECCPKKPKKFGTIEELSAHEATRRYQCSFCGNRFKTKNETERHENSLHVRRHAWSCSNIANGGDRNIFQESINLPGVADTCAYCGEDFARSGGDGACKHASEKDWAERFSHVREVHRLGECNATKKFWRADHFRQHLKHSHAATPGRWTSTLEALCIADVSESKMPGDMIIY
ncbi:hypothetical protein GGR52DRAFT_497744 [Hypoxylon sp. FL1284]|nr:hypothetical protein GGR52DRAFT_497744 [Hypoxylon sp. FL1284]